MYRVTKREGNLESFDISRIESAIRKAFMSCETEVSEDVIKNIAKAVNIWDTISIEDIQDQIIELLGDYDYPDVAAAYRSYKDKQSRARMLWRKIQYMDEYIDSNENAATMSNTDGNANTSAKNVATLEPEVFKDDFRTIQRYRMKRKLKQMYPEVAYDYEKDIEATKKIMQKYDPEKAKTLRSNYKLENTGKLKNLEDGVLIEFYIEFITDFSSGDKLCINGGNKAVSSGSIPAGQEPYSSYRPQEKIDLLTSINSNNGRMILSNVYIGLISKGLIELDRQVKEIMGIAKPEIYDIHEYLHPEITKLQRDQHDNKK